MKVLDLFSGIGGFSLAARWAGLETIAFCEIESYPREVLKKNFPNVPIHENIEDLDGNHYKGIDIITGGYPCQPFSVAGPQKGNKDHRYLWPEMLRVITQARPTWIVCENVVGHVSMGLDQVLSDLENEGYATKPFIIPACGVDARHRRDRVWIVGYSKHNGSSASTEKREPSQTCDDSEKGPEATRKLKRASLPVDCCTMAYPHSITRNVQQATKPQKHKMRITSRGQSRDYRERTLWIPEPGLGRVANGIPRRVDRIKSLGNAIVPQVAYKIFKSILVVDSIERIQL